MEEVRFLVQEEGRAARNLIAFHVPVEHAISDSTGKALTRKPPTSPRSQNEVKKDDGTRNSKRSCESPKAGSRVRSASTGRDKKSELQARYWAFLFGNLQRAVDEIYQTCETDESVSECKEVILVLENYTRDFHNLIEWFKLKWEYENTPPPQRPNSLAWEIRKSSPGKVRHNISASVPEKAPAIAVTDIERELILKAQQKDSSETTKTEKKLLAPNGKIADVDCDTKIETSVISKKTADTPVSAATSADVTTCTEVVTSVSNTVVKKQDNTERSSSAVEDSVGVNESEIQNAACSDKGDAVIHVPIGSESTVDATAASREQVEKVDMIQEISPLPQEDKTVDVNGIGSSISENVRTAADTDQNKLLQSETKNAISELSNCTGDAEKKESKSEIEEETLSVQMVHQASQTDLEQCVEDSEGLRFLSLPQKLPTVTSSAQVIKSAPVTVSRTPVAPVKSPVIPPRTGVRTPSMAASMKQQQQSSARPAYATVSRISNTSLPRTQPTTQTRAYSSPRLVRSRTSTDVRPVSRATLLRKPESSPGVVKAQRSTLVARQPRPVGQSNMLMLASAAPKVESIPETGPPLDRRSGSNSSLNSSASSGARSWADKVKGSENSRTTVSVEVLPRTGAGNEDDDMQGWETVKGRSRSRMSPANKVDGLSSPLSRSAGNIKYQALERKGSVSTAPRAYAIKKRFQQPSAATSLPALALIEVEVKPPNDSKKLAVKKTGAPARVPAYRNNTNIAKMKREIKDIKEDNKKSLKENRTSLQAKKNEENNKRVTNLVKEENNSSTDLKAEPVSFENKDSDDLKANLISKEDFQIKNEEESLTLSEHKDIIAEETISKTDNITLDEQLEDILEEKNLFNEEELRKSKELSAEEEMLRKEIHELEATEIEVDTETDETETDGEATIGPEDEEEERLHIISENPRKLKPIDSVSLEATYENQLEGMSWAERIDALEQLEEMEARHPGRALELHQKLSSPSRRRTLPETLRCFQAKQAQAKEKRDRLMHEKAQKLRELLNKVEEVKAAQAQLIEDKRVRLEMKLKRAEVNRKLHLKGIIRKAHDEEEKLKEIAFINELEAQNKRHDFMALCQEQEERLQGIQEERQRKQEEKAAKEAAVEERRRVLEAERQERLEKMQELRRKREERVGKKQQEREKERQELAREKARDREERLSALHAAQLATQEELQKKIQQKQEESARRHEENIEHIRQRALESSILRCSTDDVAPRLAPYDTQKLCEVCNVLIGSEVYLLSHLRGRKHQEAVQNQLEGQDPSREELASYNVRHIVDAPADKIDPKIALDKERQKALKKRCKKIRLRMAARGQEYEGKREVPNKIDSPNKARIQKCLRDIEKLQSSQGKGQWPNNAITALERAVGEINRILDKKNPQDQAAFQALNGFTTLSNILSLSIDVPVNMAPYLPPKCFVTSCTCYNYACRESASNSKYVLFSNKVSMILDLLLHRLSVLIPDRNRLMTGSSSPGQTALPVDAIAGGLMRLLALILNHAVPESPDNDINPKDELGIRIQDVISYTVSVGIVDKLALYCGSVRDPIDADPQAGQFLLSGLELLTTLAARCGDLRRGSSNDDPTQLVATLQVTELVGAVSMLYGMLLHQGAPPRDSASAPPALPPHTIAVTIATIRLLSRVAELDLQMFQSVLGAEGISLQFRHIASYLLWYCSQDKEKELLHEVVRVVGFFTVRNHDNQMMIQSGYMPTVLQQLCNLPFPYFSNPKLSSLLFPTLLACCSDNPENRAILEQEVSYQLLEDFRNSEVGKSNRLVSLLNASSAA